MSTTNIRAGVAGAGVFGGYHAAKYAEAAGADLVAVFDADAARADALAARHGARGFADYDAFLGAVDCVTVASPATTHGRLAEAALAAGRHVLVEKPIAMSLPEADRVVAAARAGGLTLQVGHQERYVVDALGLLSRGRPRRVESRRLNRFSGRAMDVSVVFDLMIHDLDLLARLTSGEPEILRVDARAAHGQAADRVAASLMFPDDTRAALAASRLAETPTRDLTLVYGDGTVHLDFLTRRATNTTNTPLAASLGGEGRPRALADPLAYGTETFLAAIRSGDDPVVTGEDGRAALALALTIEERAVAALEGDDA